MVSSQPDPVLELIDFIMNTFAVVMNAIFVVWGYVAPFFYAAMTIAWSTKLVVVTSNKFHKNRHETDAHTASLMCNIIFMVVYNWLFGAIDVLNEGSLETFVGLILSLAIVYLMNFDTNIRFFLPAIHMFFMTMEMMFMWRTITIDLAFTMMLMDIIVTVILFHNLHTFFSRDSWIHRFQMVHLVALLLSVVNLVVVPVVSESERIATAAFVLTRYWGILFFHIQFIVTCVAMWGDMKRIHHTEKSNQKNGTTRNSARTRKRGR